jgi:hypothetical protein
MHIIERMNIFSAKRIFWTLVRQGFDHDDIKIELLALYIKTGCPVCLRDYYRWIELQ